MIHHTRTANEADRLATAERQDEYDRSTERERHNQRLRDEHAMSVAIARLGKEIAELRQEVEEHRAFIGRCEERIAAAAKEREGLRKEFIRQWRE